MSCGHWWTLPRTQMTSLCFQRSRIVCQIQHANKSSRQPEPRLPVETESWTQALKCKMEVLKIMLDMKQIIQLRCCCFALCLSLAQSKPVAVHKAQGHDGPGQGHKQVKGWSKAHLRLFNAFNISEAHDRNTAVIFFRDELKIATSRCLQPWSLGVLKRFCREGAASKTAA